jgi:YVTN family beta-propeller protein
LADDKSKEYLSKRAGQRRIIAFSLILTLILSSSALAADADTKIPITRQSQDGYYSYKIAINEKTNTVYVTHPNSNYVSVINATTNSIVETVSTDLTPVEIAANPNTNFVYVGNSGSGTVSVMDGFTNAIIKTLKVTNYTDFNAIGGIAVNHKTNKVYVLTNEMSSSDAQQSHALITIIDGMKNKIEQTFKVGNLRSDYDVIDSARGLAINSETDMIYVSMILGSLYAIDGSDNNKIVTSLSVGEGGNGEMPTYIAVNEKTNLVYISRFDTSFVSIINGSTNKEIGSIEVGLDPQGIAIDDRSNTVFVATSGGISVVNSSTAQVQGPVKVGMYPIGLAFNSNKKSLYVANWGSNFISVISPSEWREYESAAFTREIVGDCGKTYRVSYAITDGAATVNDLKADPAVLSLSISLAAGNGTSAGAARNGTLSITMPQRLIHDEKSGALSDPVGFIDEEPVEIAVRNITEYDITMDIDFPAGSKKIEVVGSYYPEYPPYTNMIDVNVEGKQFTVHTYSAPICSYEFSAEQKKLIIHSDNTAGFAATFPKELLGGPYSVFLDGKQQLYGIDYTPRYGGPVNENATTISISMEPYRRANTIEIVGTTSIPEFSSFSMMIAAAAMLGTIVATKYAVTNRLRK